MMRRRLGNQLLDRLLEEVPSLRAGARLLRCPAGRVLVQEGHATDYVYFPVSGALALSIRLRDRGPGGLISIGSEGFAGIGIFLGLEPSLHGVVQQVGGDTVLLPSARFQRAVQRSPSVEAIFLAYAAYLLRFVHQSTACRNMHSLAQRTCRWLLHAEDWAGGDHFVLKQSDLARLLGVRRQSVNPVAARLQQAGCITYSRGHVRVLDRDGLAECACECYGSLSACYTELLRGRPR